MARNPKLTEELQGDILQLLERGNTDADVCASVGIHPGTFYRWLKTKSEFREAVSRARTKTRLVAVSALRSAMEPTEQVAQVVEIFSETRLKRDGEPYEYRRVTESATVTTVNADWRAAVEYLKRRDPDHWAEQLVIRITPDQKAVLEKHGLSAGEAMELFVKELANADR